MLMLKNEEIEYFCLQISAVSFKKSTSGRLLPEAVFTTT